MVDSTQSRMAIDLLQNIEANQQKQLEMQRQALDTQRQQFELVRAQYDKAMAIQDRAEAIQDKSAWLVEKSRKMFIVLVPLILLAVATLLLLTFF